MSQLLDIAITNSNEVINKENISDETKFNVLQPFKLLNAHWTQLIHLTNKIINLRNQVHL